MNSRGVPAIDQQREVGVTDCPVDSTALGQPPAAAPSVSVVVCSYNGTANLPVTLQALARNARQFAAFEVVLVDSASTQDLLAAPASRAAVEELRNRGVHVRIAREERPGLTSARIHGVRAATASVICFLDDDNEIEDSYLERGARYFEDSSLGVLVSRVSPRFAVEPPPAIARRQHLLAINESLGDRQIVWPPNVPSCPTIGAGLWVRKFVFLAIYEGVKPRALLPDRIANRLFSGGDIEIGIWAGRLGHQRIFAPDLQLQHHIPARRLTSAYFVRLITGIRRSEATIDRLYQLRKDLPRWLRWLRLPMFAAAALAAAMARRDSLRELAFILASELAACLGPYPLRVFETET